MICDPCKNNDHLLCPNAKRDLDFEKKRPSSGLSPEAETNQRAGLCPCQHRVTLMSPITSEEAEQKIKSGLSQECGCGARVFAGPEDEPVPGAVEFVRLWFKDHSHEDFSLHGKAVSAATQKMPAEAK